MERVPRKTLSRLCARRARNRLGRRASGGDIWASMKTRAVGMSAHRVTKAGGVVAGEVVFELAFDVAQKAGGTEAEEVGL
jgi:hypothetical protein